MTRYPKTTNRLARRIEGPIRSSPSSKRVSGWAMTSQDLEPREKGGYTRRSSELVAGRTECWSWVEFPDHSLTVCHVNCLYSQGYDYSDRSASPRLSGYPLRR